MNSQLKFSIIIPAYNEEKHIAACLQAIKNQLIPKNMYEVVVIDNCSSDNTAVIAKKYNALIIKENKKGYIHALSAGLNHARAPLIAVTDADSIPNKDWLLRLAEIYEKYPKVGYSTGTMLYDPPSFYVSLINMLMNMGAELFKVGCGFHMSFRKEAWEKIAPFPPDLNFNVDAWIAFEIGKKGYNRYFIRNNWIKSSSRHIFGIVGIKYMTKSMLNLIGLILFNKTFFYDFGDVRE